MYLAGRRPPPRGVITIPPDIAIEVVSPSPRDQRRDRSEKMDESARFGIPFCWLIDPGQKTVEINVRGFRAVYERRHRAEQGVLGGLPGCPGFTLDIDAMWARIAALENERGNADRG